MKKCMVCGDDPITDTIIKEVNGSEFIFSYCKEHLKARQSINEFLKSSKMYNKISE